MKTLKDQQIKLVNEANNEKKIFTETFDEIKNDQHRINEITKYLSEEKDENQRKWQTLRSAGTIEKATERMEKTLNAIIELIISKQIHGNIIDFDQIEKIFKELKTHLSPTQIFPYNNPFEIIQQRHAEIGLNDGTLIASIILPATRKEVWAMFKIKNHPIIRDKVITIIEPKYKFMLVNEKEQITRLENIDDCIKLKYGRMIGKIKNPIELDGKNSCASKAFFLRKLDPKLCDAITHKAKLETHMIVQTGENEIIIFTEEGLNITISCHGQKSNETIKTNSKITLKDDCELMTKNLMFLGINHENTEEEMEIKAHIDIEEIKQNGNVKKLLIFTQTNTIEMKRLGEHIKKLNEEKIQQASYKLVENKEKGWMVAIGSAISCICIMLGLVLAIICCIKI